MNVANLLHHLDPRQLFVPPPLRAGAAEDAALHADIATISPETRKRLAAGNPVLLVHGHGGKPSDLAAVGNALQKWGVPKIYNIDYAPNDGTIEQVVPQLAAKIDQIRAETGKDQVDLVTHSMGGIFARWYIDFAGGASKVSHLVMISSPNHGIGFARWALDPGGRELATDNPHIKALEQGDQTPGKISYTSIWSHMDIYTQFWPWNSAALPHIPDQTVWWGSHSGILNHPDIWAKVRDGLLRSPRQS